MRVKLQQDLVWNCAYTVAFEKSAIFARILHESDENSGFVGPIAEIRYKKNIIFLIDC